jgi:dTDP-4-dehydrorhamnose reductase
MNSSLNVKSIRVLVLGASGMLGNAVFRLFAKSPGFCVYGTTRSQALLRFMPKDLHEYVITGVDVENINCLTRVFSEVRPDVVVNCIGLVKQMKEADDPLEAIPINALLPHQLAKMCELAGARFVHMSTDCIFSGSKGMYLETDDSDAKDLYGRSKYLGEVDYPNAITLRTSIIGHELDGKRSLIGWFLAQEGTVKGFKRAIFSGLPTVEIARVIRDYVIPHPELHGLYHLSSEPINKFELLTLVARVYNKKIAIVPDEQLVIDLSLNSSRFQLATGFHPPAWPDLVSSMRDFG